jgi:hypothetical protein
VQHRDVVGVDHILEMLQPVAGNDRRAAAADRGVVGLDELALVHPLQAVIARQHRLFLGGAEIGEDQPIPLPNGIPGLAHLVLEQSALGLAGLLQAMALGVEFPAVIAAADAVILDLAVIERGAAMAAAGVQQADTAALVAKQDEIFAEDANFPGDIGGIGDQSDRVPIAAEQFAHRRAAPDRSQFGPRRGRSQGIAGSEIAIPLADRHCRVLPADLSIVGSRRAEIDDNVNDLA